MTRDRAAPDRGRPRRATSSERALDRRRGLLAGRGELPRVSRRGRFLLVSSAGSARAGARIRRALARTRILADLEIDDRESAKTLVDRLAASPTPRSRPARRRDDALVAVGGGVVSDVAGFAAAILLRGIAWNAVPTTTAAMADAAIGGKTGVDHAAGKNLLGAFHPPRADPDRSRPRPRRFPERDYRAGLVEAFKAAWIADADLAERARAAAFERSSRATRTPLLDAARRSGARSRRAIVSEDLKEGDRRRLLNFGHTLGHAFEAAGGYRTLRHGEAVAWGIAAALGDLPAARRPFARADADRDPRAALARLGPFPSPSRDPRRLAPFLGPRQEGDARAESRASCSRGSAGRRVVEAVPSTEWLGAAASGLTDRRIIVGPCRRSARRRIRLFVLLSGASDSGFSGSAARLRRRF